MRVYIRNVCFFNKLLSILKLIKINIKFVVVYKRILNLLMSTVLINIQNIYLVNVQK